MSDALDALRRAFDQGFSLPPPDVRHDHVALIALAIGTERYALRVSELAGLEPAGCIVPLPGGTEPLLGICGLRGRLVPIFDLGALVGQPVGKSPRWLALHGDDPSIGLAFTELEGYLQADRADLLPATTRHATEAVKSDASLRPILDLPSLKSTLGQRAGLPAPKEPS